MPERIPNLDLTGTGYCASFSFRRTARAVTRLFDEALQESGIRSTQFAILIAIAKFQPTVISALADYLVTDHTTLTRSLHLLKKNGFIAISDRATKRQRFLTLTPKGEQVLRLSVPAWRKAQERFESTLGADHWRAFRFELQRIAAIAVELEVPKPLPGILPPGL